MAYNDAVQVVVLILGSALLTIYGLIKLGGWGELRQHLRLGHVQPLEAAHPAGRGGHLGAGEGSRRQSSRPGTSTTISPGWAWLICAPVIGLWYWCTDQYIVQRALGAPNEQNGPPRQHLRRLPQAVPRLSVHHSGPDLLRPGQERQGAGVGAASMTADGQPMPHRRSGAFPLMVALPAAGRAARHRRGRTAFGLMGSLAGVFNACSTLFTVDLYEKWKPKASAAPDWCARAASPPPSWC